MNQTLAFGIATVALAVRGTRTLFYSSPALYSELLVLFVVWAVLAILMIVQRVKAASRVDDDGDFAEFVFDRWVMFEDEFGDTVIIFKHSIDTLIHDMTLAPDTSYCFLVRADSQKWMVDQANAELIAAAIGAPSPMQKPSGEIPTVQLTDTPRNAGDIPF